MGIFCNIYKSALKHEISFCLLLDEREAPEMQKCDPVLIKILLSKAALDTNYLASLMQQWILSIVRWQHSCKGTLQLILCFLNVTHCTFKYVFLCLHFIHVRVAPTSNFHLVFTVWSASSSPQPKPPPPPVSRLLGGIDSAAAWGRHSSIIRFPCLHFLMIIHWHIIHVK